MLRLAVVLLILATPLRADVPRVVVDIPPVHSLVAQVMEGVGTPELILPPGLSPHDVALRPSDASALAQADLVVWIGPELSRAFARSVDALAQGRVLGLLEVPDTVLLGYRQGAVFSELGGGDEHDHDHDQGSRDPHAWLDPVNAALWLGAIAQALAQIDPTNAEAYTENAAAAAVRLGTLQGAIDTRIIPLRGQPFVVFHDAYHYFEARFEIEAAGAIALGDGGAPGPRRLVEIGQAAQDLGVTCVFVEPQFNAGYVGATLPREGARVGVIDPLGFALTPGPQLYETLLTGMVASFEQCLGAE